MGKEGGRLIGACLAPHCKRGVLPEAPNCVDQRGSDNPSASEISYYMGFRVFLNDENKYMSHQTVGDTSKMVPFWAPSMG